MKYIYLVFLLLVNTLYASPHKPLEKISLQLVWLHQFQFAGYYMAKEKGFYKDAGFDVDIYPFKHAMDVYKEVTQGRADYGVGRSSLVQYDSSGDNIVLLGAIFQSSPQALLTLESSGIEKLEDFAGKSMMQTKNLLQSAAINAMIKSTGVSLDDIHIIEHSFNIEDLINHNVDIYSAYISNEPYLLNKEGIRYKAFSPKDYGFDFYSDILFTTQEHMGKHPQEIANFRAASLKGWKYAFSHIDETVDLILEKYNQQHKSREALLYEAKALKKLAYYKTNDIGEINKEKIQRTYDVYNLFGLAKEKLDVDALVYQEYMLTQEEKKYLKKKQKINICILVNSMPYSAIENGKYVGIGAQILELTTKRFGLNYKLVESDSWMDSLKKGVNKECDLLPIALKTDTMEKLFNFTTPYHDEPLVVITQRDKNYIVDFNTVLDKKFSVVRGHAFVERLKKDYPGIKLDLVKTTQEGLMRVKQGLDYGHIDVLIAGAYAIKTMRDDSSLQISGQLPKKIAVRFATAKGDKKLLSIFEKVAQSLKPSDLQKILNDWVQINYANKIHFQYLTEVISFFVFLLGIFSFKHYILNKKNETLQELQEQILEINHNLEKRIDEAVSDLEKAQSIAKIGSWIFDLQTKELKWSKETYRIFGVEEQDQENLYKKFIARIHPQEKDHVIEQYQESLKRKTHYQLEHRLLMEDGSIKYVYEKCETTYAEDGTAIISYGTVQDITESVLIKEELKRKDAYLLQQSRLAQMGEMLSMIAHQWKQPLGAISATQVAVKTVLYLEKYDLEDTKERKDFFKYLHEKLDQIALYVQNLSQTITDFSSFYKPHTSAKVLDVDETIQRAYRLIEESVKFENININFSLKSNQSILMHENEFMQVILNIISNAKEQLLDQKRENPTIEVRSYVSQESLYIEIEDNAGGIDEKIIDNIFNPYFSTKLEKNGTGLGLYMAKIILKDYHNGDIYVKNGLKGAIFTIRIDRVKSQGESESE